MSRYIAFIRGINAGLRLKMTDLSQLFENLGFTNVQTVLATGNVIFDASSGKQQIVERIEQEIASTYGYKTIVVLFTQKELQKLVEATPFEDRVVTLEASQHVSFLAKKAQLPFDLPYSKLEKGYTILRQIDNALYSTIDLSGKTRPDLIAVLDRIFNSKVTTRNWKTIEHCYKAMLHE